MRTKQLLSRALLALVVVILFANIAFWVLVGLQFHPVKHKYDDGMIVRIGSVALVFGHGGWETRKGIENHMTLVASGDSVIHAPTIRVIDWLHKDGAKWIWGTWCNSGDHDYIERDLITGREVKWPKYVSRNKRPGETLPIWIGVGFIRLSIGERHPIHDRTRSVPLDTVVLKSDLRVRPLTTDRERILLLTLEVRLGLTDVGIDSITGVRIDTVTRDFTRSDALFDEFTKTHDYDVVLPRIAHEMRMLREDYEERFRKSVHMNDARIWIRGSTFPVWVKTEPVVVVVF